MAKKRVDWKALRRLNAAYNAADALRGEDDSLRALIRYAQKLLPDSAEERAKNIAEWSEEHCSYDLEELKRDLNWQYGE